MTDETMNLLRRAKSASPVLLAAACLLSSFAARAHVSHAAPSAATATEAPEQGALPASVESSSGPANELDLSQSKFAPASLDVDTDLDMQMPGDPDDAPAPPPPPPNWRPRRRKAVPAREARTGPIFGFGVGGAQQYLSGAGHAGGIDGNLRLGYGFSDRLQLFFDGGDSQTPDRNGYNDLQLSVWHLRTHLQTVLIGDRRGNGLNLNVGIGIGGVSTNGYTSSGTYHDGTQVGLSLGGGISYEARLSPHFALAPEFFASWQQVPNDYNLPNDIAWTVGGRLNFIWYSPF